MRWKQPKKEKKKLNYYSYFACTYAYNRVMKSMDRTIAIEQSNFKNEERKRFTQTQFPFFHSICASFK